MARRKRKPKSTAPQTAKHVPKAPPATLPEFSLHRKLTWTLPILVLYGIIGTWGQFDFRDMMGYYNMLADALLAGRLSIAITPDQLYLHDMIPFEGKYYLQWGPVPAVFHMAFKVVGVTLSDRVACMVAGWLSCCLFLATVLRLRSRFFPNLPETACLWLLYAFAFATPTALVSLRGSVYHESIVFGAMFVQLSFWALLRYVEEPHPKWTLLAGVGVGLAAGCRVPLVLHALAPLGMIVAMCLRKRLILRTAFGHAALLGLPILGSGLIQMANNQARFGSPFDYGNQYLPDARGRTPFQLAAIPANIRHYILAPPLPSSDFPWLEHRGWDPENEPGRAEDMSSFILMSPFVLLGLVAWPLVRGGEVNLRLYAAATAGASLLGLSSMLCFLEASRRYMQDFVPIMMIAATMGLGLVASDLPAWWRRWRPLAWTVLGITTLLHAHLSFTQGFTWDPPDTNVVRTFVSWTPTLNRIMPGEKLAAEAAMAANDLGTVYMREGRHQEALREFERALGLMPDSPLIQRNVELARAYAAR